jgi:Flp pilus assembly protein TadG
MITQINKRNGKQAGVTTVEFAIVGLLVFTIIFGAIEMGRMLFTLNTLRELTYRGARVAVVCPVGDPKIQLAALFDAAGTGNSVLPNLTGANIQVDYLDQSGAILGAPATNPDFANIDFVRVQIVNYSHTFIVPGANISSFSFITKSYPTTLPKESLGINREAAGAVAC